SGAYGVRDVCFSIPTVIGRNGVKSHIEVELWSKEKTALLQSANVLKDTISKVTMLGRRGATVSAARQNWVVLQRISARTAVQVFIVFMPWVSEQSSRRQQ
ncbi:MAG: hypothetical protein ACKPHU_06610, partial [Planctomycetaceae bacterium]